MDVHVDASLLCGLVLTYTWVDVAGFGGAGGEGGGAGGVGFGGAGGAGVTKHGVEPVHVMLIWSGSASCRFLSMLSNVNATPPPDDGTKTLSPLAATSTGGL